MRLGIYLVAVAGVLSCFLLPPARAQGQPCGCADKEVLLNALNMSQAAIQELNFQLEYLKDWEAAHGKVIYTSKTHKEMEERLSEALSEVRRGQGDDFGGYQMKLGDCSISENPGQSACARQIEKSLIDVYKKACEETKNVPLERNPYRETRQVMLHKISAYQAMQNFALAMLKALPKNCRPNDWFGYVVFQRVWTEEIKKYTPPTDTGGPLQIGLSVHNGRSEITNYKRTYAGTVWVEEGKAAHATGAVAWSFDKRDSSTGRAACTPKKPNVFWAFTGGETNFAEGQRDGNASFLLNVYPAKKNYAISVKFFSVNVTGQQNSYRTVSGGCGKEGTDKQSHPVNKLEDGGTYNLIKAELNPAAPDYLEGSKIEKPPELNRSTTQGNITITNTNEILMRWMLRRLPAK